MLLLLHILKIIGFVVLALLLVLLVLLILILFLPIHYYMDADLPNTRLDEDESADQVVDQLHFRLGFHYLFHLIRGKMDYPQKKGKPLAFRIYVLFFQIFPKKEKKENGKSKHPKERKNRKDKEEKNRLTIETLERDDAGAGTEEQKTAQEPLKKEEADAKETEAEVDEEESEEVDEAEGSSTIKDYLSFVRKALEKMISSLKHLQDVAEKIKCTIYGIYGKINAIKSTIENPIFERAYENAKKRIFTVLRKIFPRKGKIYINYDLDDPALNAEILGAYYALRPFLPGDIQLNADFENRLTLGFDVEIKGRICLFTILWNGARLYFDKDVKKTIRRFRKIFNR